MNKGTLSFNSYRCSINVVGTKAQHPLYLVSAVFFHMLHRLRQNSRVSRLYTQVLAAIQVQPIKLTCISFQKQKGEEIHTVNVMHIFNCRARDPRTCYTYLVGIPMTPLQCEQQDRLLPEVAQSVYFRVWAGRLAP